MAKALRKASQFSSHRAEKAFNKKFDAKPPTKKASLKMETISKLQDEFRAVIEYNGPKKSQCKPTGEFDGDFMRVYKYQADGPWCFKAAVPLTAKSAAAVSVYLAGLESVAPDYVNAPERNGPATGVVGASR